MLCKKCKTEIPDESIFCLMCGKKQAAERARKPKSRGNGTGTAYRRGRTWTAKIVCGKKIDPKTGRRVADIRTKGGFSTKTEAINHIQALASAQRTQERPATTLAILWDNYSQNAMQKLSKGKQGHYRTAYKKLVDIIYRPIQSLTINELQDLVDEKTSTYYPARDVKALLSHLYDRAVAQDDVRTNIAKYIDLPELEEGERLPFTADDLKKIWKDYGDGNKASGYILLMAYSGMMPGELRRCEKSMICWERQQIIGCGLKTKKRKETPIVISDFIMPVLRDLCGLSDSPRLYYLEWYANFYQDFHAALARMGVEDRDPYSCRHTTATALALGNIAPEVIKEIMRHTQFSTTQRYIHKDYDAAPALSAINSIVNK